MTIAILAVAAATLGATVIGIVISVRRGNDDRLVATGVRDAAEATKQTVEVLTHLPSKTSASRP
jgi:hypothetical protein